MKINILQGAFLPVPPTKGGAIESAWFELGKEFAKHGHQVTHVSRLDQGLNQVETIDGVKHLRIGGANAVRNSIFLKILELPYVLRARKVMPSADILVTHAFWAPLLFPKLKHGKQYIHVGRYPKGQLGFYTKASRLQVPSLTIAEACKKQVPMHASKIKILPYPLTWHTSGNLNLENREKVVLYAGRIHPEKGVRYLVEAWSQIPNKILQGWTLRLIGPWREEQGGGGQQFYDSLKHIIGSSTNAIEIHDPIFERHTLKQEMEKVRFFIYPSVSNKGETFGLAVLEAMSCGCVPIVSSLPCFSDFINFGIEGFCLNEIRNRNLIEIINYKLCEILEASDLTIKNMAIASWKRAKEYELEKVADRYLEDFSSLLS